MMEKVTGRHWTRSVRYHLFPPRCAATTCIHRNAARIWQKSRPICMHDMWFCSPQCVEQAAAQILDEACSLPDITPHAHRVPLGLLMLSRGDLNERQLRLALDAQQRGEPKKIGQWLLTLKLATERQVLSALAVQWACPLLVLKDLQNPVCASMLPLLLRQTQHMQPVRFIPSERTLYLALSEKPDFAVLASVERMLDCRTVPCLVSERVMNELLEKSRWSDSPDAQTFDRITDPAEMARIATSYLTRLDAEEIRIVRCGAHIWIRMSENTGKVDLLFAWDAFSAAKAS